MNSKMTVKKKLTITGAVLMIALIAVGGGGVLAISSLSSSVNTIVNNPLPGIHRIAAMRADLLKLRGDVWRHIAAIDSAEMQALDRDIAQDKSNFVTHSREYEVTVTTESDRALFNQIKPAYDRYIQALDAILTLSRATQNKEAHDLYVKDAAQPYYAIDGLLVKEVDLNRQQGEEFGKDAQSTASSAKATLWVVMFVSITGGILLLAYIIRGVNGSLVKAVSQLSQGAEHVASAAAQVASSSQSLAQGSSEQAASLEETSASTEEINSMAQRNTENSHNAAELVTSAGQNFVHANEALDQMVVAMNEINASSEKISKIIRVIDEIAFQTNILALNAAVEAARAGEAGMGFAVVADEVRNLAQRSAQAAKDTAELIEESISRSSGGKTKVDQVAQLIRTISAQAEQVKTLVDEVNLSSQEQARGIDQVVKAIRQMEHVTQSTAASAEQSAAASQELTAQSRNVKGVVDELAEMVGSASDHQVETGARAALKPSAKMSKPSASLSKLSKAVSKPAAAKSVHVAAKSEFPLDSDDSFPLDKDW